MVHPKLGPTGTCFDLVAFFTFRGAEIKIRLVCFVPFFLDFQLTGFTRDIPFFVSVRPNTLFFQIFNGTWMPGHISRGFP